MGTVAASVAPAPKPGSGDDMPKETDWIPFDSSIKPQERRGPHQLVKMKRQPWLYCRRCGVIGLKNQASHQALKKDCVVLA
jgi:hypothetical protein